jgi:hypothetical protein
MAAEPVTIERLDRWVLFGAQWRVVEISSDHAVVDFRTCTGELVERAATDDSEVISYLRTAQLAQD